MRTVLGTIVVVCLLGVVTGGRVARADGPTWSVVELSPGEPTEREPNPPPRIRIKVAGQSAPSADEAPRWTLRQVDGKLRAVAPHAVTPYHRSSEQLALVVLIEGHEYYFGNDSYVDEPEAGATTDAEGNVAKPRSPGVYAAIREALDAPCDREALVPTGLACAGPPGSKGAIVVYSVGADVRARMAELELLTGDALGPQQAQEGKTGRQLAAGLKAATDLLKSTSASRKVLVVISDGFEANGVEPVRLAKKRLNDDNIEVLAIQLEVETKYIGDARAVRDRNTSFMELLGAGKGSAHLRARTAKELPARITDVVQDHIGNRFWLEFPGHVGRVGAPTASGFTWDGRDHEAILLLDDEPVGKPAPLEPRTWGLPPAKRPWWPWAAIAGGLVLAIGILIARRGRQPAAVVAPMPGPVAPPPPQGPIKPVQAPNTGGARTVVLSMDEIPLVGWLVPINGPNKFQTFKLAPGVTKLGGARGVVHIVVDDGYVSGEHAHIAMTPSGFTVVDNLSANGTYVNERRVDRHDLIDNDMIKLGKTDFKFKTLGM